MGKDNDVILKMKHDYGGIIAGYEFPNGEYDSARELICATCAHMDLWEAG